MMPVLRSQPSPFGYLRREKHIERLCRVPRDDQRGWESLRPQDGRSPTSGGRTTACSHQEASLGRDHGGVVLPETPAPKDASKAEEVGCEAKGWRHVGEESGEIRDQERQASPPSLLECGGRKEGSPGSLKSTKLVQEVEDAVCAGLQSLAGMDQLCITSRAKFQGLSCHPGRTYAICTRKAKKLFVATEETDCLCLHLCGPARSACLRLHDQNAQEVLRFCRPYRMDVCCLGCCLMEMSTFTAAGKVLGTVRQRWSMFSPLLEVCDSEGQAVMKIHGCWSTSRCYADQEFQVTSPAGHAVAVIWKRWPGYNEDWNMDHDFFGLDISAALSLGDRALLLAAAFLLNYMFFEMS